jgi:hypothetical protein
MKRSGYVLNEDIAAWDNINGLCLYMSSDKTKSPFVIDVKHARMKINDRDSLRIRLSLRTERQHQRQHQQKHRKKTVTFLKINKMQNHREWKHVEQRSTGYSCEYMANVSACRRC